MIASHFTGDGFALHIDTEGGVVTEPDAATVVVTHDDHEAMVESVTVTLVPTADGGVAKETHPAMQVTIVTADSSTLNGQTVLPDGRWWDEAYDVDNSLIHRTLVTADGVTTTTAIRCGSIEVGETYVTVGEDIVLNKLAGKWRGTVTREVRDVLLALVEEFGGEGIVPSLRS